MGPTMVVICVVLITAVADYLLKVASITDSPSWMLTFIFGCALYAITAIGWFILMKSHSLAEIGIIYSAATIIILTVMGYLLFGETISNRTIAAVGAAVTSVIFINS